MSSPELVFRYLAQRWRPSVLVPLALILVAAGWIITAPPVVAMPDLLLRSVQALLLILAARVWDDLEDRGRDACEHPERVMVTDGRTAPFVVLAVVLGAGAVVPMLFSSDAPMRLTVLGSAAITLLAWYRLRGPQTRAARWGYVVLLKYPAIALALAPPGVRDADRPASWRVEATLAGLYLLLCIYETFDDPALRGGETT